MPSQDLSDFSSRKKYIYILFTFFKHHRYGCKISVLGCHLSCRFHSMSQNLHSFEVMLGSSHPEVICEKVTLKIWQNSQGSTCLSVSF